MQTKEFYKYKKLRINNVKIITSHKHLKIFQMKKLKGVHDGNKIIHWIPDI